MDKRWKKGENKKKEERKFEDEGDRDNPLEFYNLLFVRLIGNYLPNFTETNPKFFDKN